MDDGSADGKFYAVYDADGRCVYLTWHGTYVAWHAGILCFASVSLLLFSEAEAAFVGKAAKESRDTQKVQIFETGDDGKNSAGGAKPVLLY